MISIEETRRPVEILLAIIISSPERIPNFYQNIKKKWSLELDKILNVGLYCILVRARQVAEKQCEKQKLWY
jgi:hypothetical protein